MPALQIRPTLTYILVFPLLFIGVGLVGMGMVKGFSAEPSEPPITSSQAPIGERLFQNTCATCHGWDLQGILGSGKPLIASEFVAAQTDAELQTFIIEGRRIWDAANTTGIEMPPRGGNPSLSDEQIAQIVSYIRWMNEE